MLRSGPCSTTWAVERGCSNSRAAPSQKLFQEQQQQQQTTMMHAEHVQTFAAAISSSRSGSRAVSSPTSVSWRSGTTEGLESIISSVDRREFTRSTGVRESRIRTLVGASRGGDRGLQKEGNLNSTQVLETVKAGQPQGKIKDGLVEVRIENLGINSRQIVAKITIEAPLDNVWAILTDYEHLADFIPGLAVSELLEKRHNGARLYQVGEQNLALGMKFKAKAVVDCEEKPTKVHADYIRRDIDFDTVEGDFQVFRGTWRMEQPVSKPSSSGSRAPSVGRGRGSAGEAVATILSYILIVQPKMWLPVALVEGRITTEVKTNLVCIRQRLLQSSPKK